MDKTQPTKINIDESTYNEVLRVTNDVQSNKSQLSKKFIMLYLKYYEQADIKEVIETQGYKARVTKYLYIRLTNQEILTIEKAAKKLKMNKSEFCRLAIRKGLDYYKNFGEKFLEENYQIFSILQELRELKEYQELTEKRMKILYDVITEAGVSIPTNVFKFE